MDDKGYQELRERRDQERAEVEYNARLEQSRPKTKDDLSPIFFVFIAISFVVAGYEILWQFFFNFVSTTVVSEEYYNTGAHVLSIASILISVIAIGLFLNSKIGQFLIKSVVILLFLAVITAILFGIYLFIKLIVL
jgi:hypothetical protein